MAYCRNCGEDEISGEGVINLDANGLCECCADALLQAQIMDEDERKEKDFDQSMNG